MRQQKYTQRSLAKILNCAPVTVYRFAKAANIDHDGRRPYTLGEATAIAQAIYTGSRSRKAATAAAGFIQTLGGSVKNGSSAPKEEALRKDEGYTVHEDTGILLELIDNLDKRLNKMDAIIVELTSRTSFLENNALLKGDKAEDNKTTTREEVLWDLLKLTLGGQ